MSALILKSVSHLYKIFKVYLMLAVLGALAVIAYEVLLSRSLNISAILFSVFCLGLWMLWLSEIHITFGRAKPDAEDSVKKYPGFR
jgi:hypothetical protein